MAMTAAPNAIRFTLIRKNWELEGPKLKEHPVMEACGAERERL